MDRKTIAPTSQFRLSRHGASRHGGDQCEAGWHTGRRPDGRPTACGALSALKYAVELELLPHNPLKQLKLRRPIVAEAVDRRVVVNHAQARALLAAVREAPWRQRHATGASLAGARRDPPQTHRFLPYGPRRPPVRHPSRPRRRPADPGRRMGRTKRERPSHRQLTCAFPTDSRRQPGPTGHFWACTRSPWSRWRPGSAS